MSNSVVELGTLSDKAAAEVRAEMARKRLSGREMARRMGRSSNWVSLKASGTSRLDLDELAMFATALDLQPLELVRRAVTAEYPPEDVPRIPAPRSPLTSRYPGTARPAGRTPDNRPPRGSRRTSPVAA